MYLCKGISVDGLSNICCIQRFISAYLMLVLQNLGKVSLRLLATLEVYRHYSAYVHRESTYNKTRCSVQLPTHVGYHLMEPYAESGGVCAEVLKVRLGLIGKNPSGEGFSRFPSFRSEVPVTEPIACDE